MGIPTPQVWHAVRALRWVRVWVLALSISSVAPVFAQELPVLSVADASAGEADGTIDFVASLSASASSEVTVHYATGDGSAVAGRDYTEATGTLTFAPDETRKTIAVTLLDDDAHEASETFSVSLSGAVGATLDDGTGTGTIRNDDDHPLITVRGSQGPEGGFLDFVVTLSAPSYRTVSMTYETDGNPDEYASPPAHRLADPRSDFVYQKRALTFAPGETSKTVRVQVLEDLVDEPVEAVVLTLLFLVNARSEPRSASDACPWGFCTAWACCDCGTILDNDLAELSVGDASAPENAPFLTFEAELGAPTDVPVSFSFSTSDRTAQAGEDYHEASGSVTIPVGESRRAIEVALMDDDVYESDETFAVTLSDPVGAKLADPEGVGTIADDEGPPEFSVVGGLGVEGGDIEFRVRLSGARSRSSSVSYATDDLTAMADEDYVAASGTLTFAPGESSRTVSVLLVEDEREEPEETFALRLSSATNARISNSRAHGTITDNDDPPRVSIGDAVGKEGESAAFAVTLSAASGNQVWVVYETSDVTAIAGEDYIRVAPENGSLTIAAGELEQTISVNLKRDGKEEPDETFMVELTYASHALLGAASGTGTIQDAYDAPALSVGTASGVEGSVAEFPVRLDAVSDVEVKVDYATQDGTAVAGEDYVATRGALTFAAGEGLKTVSVTLVDDDVEEIEEAFVLQLRSPTNATLAVSEAMGRILDDDEPPSLPVLSIAGAEGVEAGVIDFVVTLAGSSDRPVTVSYATSDGTAIAGEDYEAVSGTLTFAPGEFSQTLSVSLLEDEIDEPNETFTVRLSSPENATIATGAADGTILDNDGALQLSIAGASGSEGGDLDFVVLLAGTSAESAAVSYATSDGAAIAGEDYRAVSGRLTFAAGESSRTLSVSLVDDALHEPTETFTLTLSSPENAEIAVGSAMGRIEDDDALPALSVADGAGEEGGVVEFAVVLADNGSERATVDYATKDVTAIAGEDYLAAQGTLTFAPGEARKTVSVTLLDDEVDEPEETFALELSSPSNVTLSVNEAVGRILDDDDRLACMAPSPGRVLLFERSSHADRQGFVRIVNHSAEVGEVLVEAIDDSGARFGPVPLAIGAGAATHFNSDDLEAGNADKGLPEGVGPLGEGAWRLELWSELDIEVLSYMRTRDGFVTALHDTAPATATAGVHRAVFLNPGGNVDQLSRLRLVNWGLEDARVTIAGTDDLGGESPEVVVEVPAGTAREWTATDLESGLGTAGSLGEGDGKWRLAIASDRPVVVLSLIENPTGHLTNLSTLPHVVGLAQGSHAVPLFPSASDPLRRQGFVRVANRSGEAEEVRIEAFDRNGWDYAPLSLAVAAGETVSFNSDDLELGNAEKGLTGSTGPGEGDWWLELSGGADIGVGSYVRTGDGFLTSMHDPVPEWDGGYRVVFFNPAENPDQVSVLWLVNPGDADAAVTIAGVDDRGVTPGTAVRTTVAAGSSRRLTSTELETGESGAIDSGALGDGKGKWRFRVDSDQPIRVMSLIENPTGHLTNLSTAPDCRPAPDRAPAL